MTTYPVAGAYAEPAYPARFDFDAPERIANWRPLVHWLLAIPHLLVVEALQSVAQVLAVISWFAILFTGRLPTGIARFQAMYFRYTIRTATYAGFLREEYPPFTLDTTTTDPGDDPARSRRRRPADRGPQPVDHRVPAHPGHPPCDRAGDPRGSRWSSSPSSASSPSCSPAAGQRPSATSPSVSAGGGCGCRLTCTCSQTSTRRSPSTSFRCPPH